MFSPIIPIPSKEANPTKMNLKRSALLAALVCALLFGGWELYLRKAQGLKPSIQPTKELWAVQRHRVKDLDSTDYIAIGSSRILFDLQRPVWEEKIGEPFLQLAVQGSSPLPVFRDLVRNTEFKGTILLGVTPGLFFSTTFPEAPPIAWPQEYVDYYFDRTHAQVFNHHLYMPLQKNLVLAQTYENDVDGNYDLKSMTERLRFNNREGRPPFPPFYEFGEYDEFRNTRMMERVVHDTLFARYTQDAWMCFAGGDMPPPDRMGTFNHFMEDLEIFQARGGKMILFRFPSTEEFRVLEKKAVPRYAFWSLLVQKTGLPAYHFEDYPELQGMEVPEWSHLSAASADLYSERIIDILLKDGIITKNQN